MDTMPKARPPTRPQAMKVVIKAMAFPGHEERVGALASVVVDWKRREIREGWRRRVVEDETRKEDITRGILVAMIVFEKVINVDGAR